MFLFPHAEYASFVVPIGKYQTSVTFIGGRDCQIFSSWDVSNGVVVDKFWLDLAPGLYIDA